jgi:poly(A) polymerase
MYGKPLEKTGCARETYDRISNDPSIDTRHRVSMGWCCLPSGRQCNTIKGPERVERLAIDADHIRQICSSCGTNPGVALRSRSGGEVVPKEIQAFPFDKPRFGERLLFDRIECARDDRSIGRWQTVEDPEHIGGRQSAGGYDLETKGSGLLRHDANASNWSRASLEQHGRQGYPLHLRSALVGESLNEVLLETELVAKRFTKAGFSLYLVGGIVRDLELGFAIDQLDFDLTTNARPVQIKSLVAPLADAIWDQGERFGTIGCIVGGREFEITTHRAEWYSSDSRKPDVVFGDDIEVDLSRRDFTVNAMAINVVDGNLIDPFDGRGALTRRELRTPIDPEVSFSDDPLRIMRAARFIARYDLGPTPAIVAAATTLADRLGIVSAERIREELDKLLAAERPGIGLRFLSDVGALPVAIPCLTDERAEQAIRLVDATPVSRAVRRGAVFASCAAGDRRDQISAFRYSNEEKRSLLSLLAGLDMVDGHDDGSWPDEKVRRLVDATGYSQMDVLFAVSDALSSQRSTLSRQAFTTLDAAEDLTSFDPVSTGDEIMTAFGLEPGPQVGEALKALRERRLRAGPTSANEELAYLRRLAATED